MRGERLARRGRSLGDAVGADPGRPARRTRARGCDHLRGRWTMARSDWLLIARGVHRGVAARPEAGKSAGVCVLRPGERTTNRGWLGCSQRGVVRARSRRRAGSVLADVWASATRSAVASWQAASSGLPSHPTRRVVRSVN